MNIKVGGTNPVDQVEGQDVVGRAQRVVVKDGHLHVDGKDITEQVAADGGSRLRAPIVIEIHGDIQELTVDHAVTVSVHGNVDTLRTVSGDVKCQNVGAIATVSGDVECGDVAGNISTVSGDVTGL